MTTGTISPLRRRVIEDMNARNLSEGTQRGHIRGRLPVRADGPAMAGIRKPARNRKVWERACAGGLTPEIGSSTRRNAHLRHHDLISINVPNWKLL